MPTILIIDDEPAITEVVAEVLTEEGYDTLTANGGRDAIELLVERHPDLMLLDVYMPEMSGFDLLAYIRRDRALSSIPVVMMTAGTLGALDLSQSGPAPVISKPFDVEDLIATVRTML